MNGYPSFWRELSRPGVDPCAFCGGTECCEQALHAFLAWIEAIDRREP